MSQIRPFFASLAVVALAGASLLQVGCAADSGSGEAAPGSSESNLDTSGCSGEDRTAQAGPVGVSAARPPTSSCWNIASSGLTLTYSWSQQDDARALEEKKNLGFWTSLNGAGTFAKASATRCSEASSGGLSPDTSGNRFFDCVATVSFDFGHSPDLLRAAYGPNGDRTTWNVQVAVSLDDGTWDSLGGANYRFTL